MAHWKNSFAFPTEMKKNKKKKHDFIGDIVLGE